MEGSYGGLSTRIFGGSSARLFGIRARTGILEVFLTSRTGIFEGIVFELSRCRFGRDERDVSDGLLFALTSGSIQAGETGGDAVTFSDVGSDDCAVWETGNSVGGDAGKSSHSELDPSCCIGSA